MDTDHDMRVTTLELMAVFNATQKVNPFLATKTKVEVITFYLTQGRKKMDSSTFKSLVEKSDKVRSEMVSLE